ncbi:GAF domain-containing protein [Paenarthrobacter ureafaciens]|uniref:GAF domain-containing protein n=1 Tax=Paenarthrobacter TaxID=1742992 RepID=UPI0022322AD3|nr:GAF domain-containing protein [Paenarthrobacter sp. PAE-2]MCW3765093.1 GAF domain-containing protein [Paenarthrobacter sp. PAE-2]
MRNPIQPPLPGSDAAQLLQRRALSGHEHLDGLALGADHVPGLRRLVRESWQRSAQLKANPDAAEAPLAMDSDELEDYRRQHPLATIMPVIRKLLIQPSHESGLLVAVGDEVGRLLWVDGDPVMQRRAEGMMFVAGSDWSEASVGTSAPGTALALDRSIQISGAEHFKRSVHPWSCTAVPFHDPDSGALLGVVDITGTEAAVAPHTLSLVEATVAAAQAQLRIERLQLAAAAFEKPRRRSSPPGAAVTGGGVKDRNTLYRNSLQLLGRDQALLSLGGRSVTLSARHSEILAILGNHPEGLSADELCARLYPGQGSAVTLRAEMVRLRKVVQELSPEAVPESRPYRLPVELLPDSDQVLSCLQRGAHRIALEIYKGAVLPRSEAPGVVPLRERVSHLLREALLTDGSVDSLLKYAALPEAKYDADLRLAILRLLPPRSPKRAAIVADLERLEDELGA